MMIHARRNKSRTGESIEEETDASGIGRANEIAVAEERREAVVEINGGDLERLGSDYREAEQP